MATKGQASYLDYGSLKFSTNDVIYMYTTPCVYSCSFLGEVIITFVCLRTFRVVSLLIASRCLEAYDCQKFHCSSMSCI